MALPRTRSPPARERREARRHAPSSAPTSQLIHDAAAILGKTRTEFMIASAHAQAIDVLLDRRLFVLGNARHAAFVDALDNPPAPGPKLRALLRRGPGWASDANT